MYEKKKKKTTAIRDEDFNTGQYTKNQANGK